MKFKKLDSTSLLSLIAGVLLVGGLGVAIFAAQQQQDQRSKASGPVPGDLIQDNTTLPTSNISRNGPEKKYVNGLVAGARYKIVVGGYYKYQEYTNNSQTDAQWDDWLQNSPNCFCRRVNKVNFNEQALNASDYQQTSNPNHEYKFLWTAPESGQLEIYITDTHFHDNAGNLYFRVYLDELPVTPTDTPTPIDEPSDTPTPTQATATVTPMPGSTKLNLDLALHGIGKGGDAANPNAIGNTNLVHLQRQVKLEVFDAQNHLVDTFEGLVIYNTTSGSFKGVADIGTEIDSGVYTVKVKLLQSLKTLVPGIQIITKGTLNNLPKAILQNGDINNDNAINIVDFDILLGCYSDLLPAENCTSEKKIQADITDDGSVNQFDYNLFLRELSNQTGQ